MLMKYFLEKVLESTLRQTLPNAAEEEALAL
jgi:hypothetical protein